MKRWIIIFLILSIAQGCKDSSSNEWIIASRQWAGVGEGVYKEYLVRRSDETKWIKVHRMEGFDYVPRYEYTVNARYTVEYLKDPPMDASDRIIRLEDIRLISKEKKESEGLDPRNIWNPTWPDGYNPWEPQFNPEEWNIKYGNWADGYEDPDPYKEYE